MAVAPDLEENSENLSQILSHLGIEAVEHVTGDLKICMYNNFDGLFIKIFITTNHYIIHLFVYSDGVVLGKAGGNQTYGCVYCDLPKPYPMEEGYNLLNFDIIHKLHQVQLKSHI